MAPRKPDSECYLQGTSMKLSEAVARQNGKYKPTQIEKATIAAKKLPTATQTTLSAFVSFVAKKAHDMMPDMSHKVEEPLVVLPEDPKDDYYWEDDKEGVETGEEHDYKVVKGPILEKGG